MIPGKNLLLCLPVVEGKTRSLGSAILKTAFILMKDTYISSAPWIRFVRAGNSMNILVPQFTIL